MQSSNSAAYRLDWLRIMFFRYRLGGSIKCQGDLIEEQDQQASQKPFVRRGEAKVYLATGGEIESHTIRVNCNYSKI